MNLHQVLTGAANDGNKCFAVGSIDGQHFTAYAAGCNIVILDGRFTRVQIISGTELGFTSELTCLSCCKDYGKIVASYGNKVRMFEPVPVIRAEGKKTLNYQWSQTSLITLEEDVEVLTWNCFGSRLLVSSGKTLQIWEESDSASTFDPHEKRPSAFFIGDPETNGSVGGQPLDDEIFSNEWRCIWKMVLANPAVMMKFSSDGSLFATAGKNDRLVKIWYENVKVSKASQESVISNRVDSTSFSFVYVAHPRTVTGFSWRQTSRYIQRGILANMLLTSCKDAICRIWCETFLPDDGLLDSRQALDSLRSGACFGQSSGGQRRNSQHHNHKHRLVQRLTHIRKMLHKKKRRHGPSNLGHQSHGTEPMHNDHHRHGNHPSDVAVELHFHLAASIDFGADIPTIGSFSDGCCPSNFVTHWLNNKEFHTNLLVEKMLEDIWKKSFTPDDSSQTPEGQQYRRQQQGSEAGIARADQGEDSWEDLGAIEGEEERKVAGGGHQKGLQNVGSDPSMNEKHQRLQRLGKAKTFVSVEAEKTLESGTNHASSFHSESNVGSDRTGHFLGEMENDQWESQIDHMIMIWNETSDVLFSIHPMDGSLLIWTVQYLDEAGPGMFRQAQVHFNSRLPRAFPAYDASTMLASPWVYYESNSTLESHVMYEENVKSLEVTKGHQQVRNPFLLSPSKLSPSSPLPPRVFLLSKHSNGSLNLWDIAFSEESRFSNAVGVTHVARVCGHRYHTNSAICHPVLPLLLTTSHLGNGHDCDSDIHENGYCSELILWKVDPIGPLSRSGGINELARVNSSVCSAFADVAWIPSLLPDQKTSPSSLFVASDGSSLHVYQAVFDARSLLENLKTSLKKEAPLTPIGDETWTAQQAFEDHPDNKADDSAHRIISHQSTSRPGCIIDLLPIEDTYRSWHQIQLMHIFQERMVFSHQESNPRCQRSSKEGGEGSFVDLQDSNHFREKFYLVVFQKLSSPSSVTSVGGSSPVPYGTVVFTWEIVVAYSAANRFADNASGLDHYTDLEITSKKVCQQLLPLPQGVSVTSAAVAVGHLCSSSIYPACFAPYLVSTACSNGEVYFWNCKFESNNESDEGSNKLIWKQWEMMSSAKEGTSSIRVGGQLLFVSCAYSGRVAVAYKVGGSVTGYSRQDYDNQQDYLKDLFSNLKVAIYQCEATGGSEWTLEDTIPLRTISLPDLKFDIDPHFLYDFDRFVHHPGVPATPSVPHIHHHHHHHHHYPHPQSHGSSAGLHHSSHDHARPVLPSCASLHNLRRALSTKSPKLLAQRARPFVFLDWISAEDGTHVLTVGVGSQIILYGPASLEMARTIEARDRLTDSGSAPSAKSSSGRGKLQKSATLVAPNRAPQVIRWIKLRMIDLYTADGLAPFPVHISWVRSGILVVGMDNEMHVFSQWPDLDSPLAIGQSTANGEAVKSGAAIKEEEAEESIAENEKASVKEESKGLLPRTQSLVSAMTKSMSTAWLVDAVFKDPKKEAMDALNGNVEQIQGTSATEGTISNNNNALDEVATLNRVGLFEASRLACPTLPQYHPKQLLELLNFGKVKRVKAILWHLLRCVADADDESADSKKSGKSEPRASSCFGQVSIAPLPLYALLSADDSSTSGGADRKQRTNDQSISMSITSSVQPSNDKNNYDALFSLNFDSTLEENPFIDLDPEASAAKEQQQLLSRKAASGLGPSGTFGPLQAQLLSGYLTRSSLPGLTGLDQMYLLALAETVAHTKLDFKEGPVEQGRTNGHMLQRPIPSSPEPSSAEGSICYVADASVDDCGLRYLLATRHHMHLINSLPVAQRLQLQKVGLSSGEFVWAFHSDSQEELLNTLPCMQKGNPTWKELKQFGVGWWLRNVTSLSRCMEKVAKTAFQESKDPLDSALLYLAMKKKNVLWGLFRSVNNTRMAQFFKNNFSDDRWRRAALKNAFALIGLQKFQCAAAFFLLAGSISDAIEVCLKNLNDFQLAMVVLRLYEGDLGDNAPPAYKKLLLQRVLGGSLDRSVESEDLSHQESDERMRSPDPFLRSMAYWIFHDYAGSLSTLLESASGGSLCDDYRALLERQDFGGHPSSRRPQAVETRGLGYAGTNLGRSAEGAAGPDESAVGSAAMSSVFNFYVYLRTHPLILRQQAALGKDSKTLPSDCITPTERRLYFLTAHEHFKNGCPALALEVLMKLPPYIVFPEEEEESEETTDPLGGSGRVGRKDPHVPNVPAKVEAKAEDFDWSKPILNAAAAISSSKVEDFDWSQPLSSRFGGDDDDDELKLDFGLDDDDEDDDDGNKRGEEKVEEMKLQPVNGDDDNEDGDHVKMNKKSDIMAQQLKFVACLNMIADELSTLASGYGVDGGQLRFHLYYWLEKEVQVLEKVCNYCPDVVVDDQVGYTSMNGGRHESFNGSDSVGQSPSCLSNGQNYEMSEARDGKITRRHAWLRTNHNLLVTLLSYTILHGSSGGGFASVRTEILLLLQELQELNANRRKTILAALTPTKVPLLNSNLSSSRTVVADLVQYLQGMCHDLLSAFSDMRNVPDSEYPQHKIYYIFSIGTALSACMYQSLSDNESFLVMDKQNTAVGLDDFFSNYERRRSSHFTGGVDSRTVLSSIVEPPKTNPSDWPGVSSLTLLIKQNKDEDLPRLNVLLLESLLSVHLSLLCYAMASYDAPVLCRLIGRPLAADCWGVVFGGGVKQLVKSAPEGNSQPKHRVKLAVKTIGPQAFQQRFADTRSTYQEKFVPPKMSIIDYFLSKPSQEAGTSQQQFRKEDDSNDSDTSHDSEIEEDYEDGRIDDVDDDDDNFKASYKIKTKKEPKRADKMHVDPRSLPWQLMRYAVLKFVNMNLKAFLPAVGFNPSELAHTSSSLNAVVKNMVRWEAHLKEELDANPDNLNIPGLYAEPTSMFACMTAQKYSSIKDPQNTPFLSKHRSAKPVKKLWHTLVCKEQLQDVFIKYAFKGRDERHQLQQVPETEPMKIIHKDQEVITSFAINQTGLPTTVHLSSGAAMMHLNCVAMATHKEIIEVDMSKIVEPPDWLGHDVDYDIEVIQNPMSHGDKPEDLLLLRAPYDSKIMNGALGPSSPEGAKGSSGGTTVIKGISIPGITNPGIFCYIVDRSRRLMQRILRRPDAGVRRLAAHPLQPIYVSGADDGCVKLWEWGHPNMVAEVRKSGAFPKVTMVAFNDHGNKIGISDVEGSLSMWQVGDRSTLNKPYLSMKCHSKTTHCFTFLGCSSLLCTSGHSADSRNVALWDTLLPQRKMLIQSFPCHSEGSPSVVYAPSHQLVISGGKKGEICIFDVRQRQLRHTFQAHSSAVKCLTVDPSEEFFVSGSADGDIKVWSLAVHSLLHAFTAEHSRASSNLFRNATSGVIQVTTNARGHLFSCGNDGTMKIRRLFHPHDGIGRTDGRNLFGHREDLVQTWGKTYY